MATETKIKICRDCGSSKPLTDYYKHRNGTQQRCKPCHAIKRKQYANNTTYIPKQRTNGFTRLPFKIQSAIREDIKAMTIVDLSIKYNIHKCTLATWKHRNVIGV